MLLCKKQIYMFLLPFNFVFLKGKLFCCNLTLYSGLRIRGWINSYGHNFRTCEMIPETTAERTNYTRRSSQNTSHMRTLTKALQNSFIPLTVKEWNSLLVAMRELGPLEQFKQEITLKLNKPLSYFYDGKRKFQILHMRLGMQSSDLHENLFNKGLPCAGVVTK